MSFSESFISEDSFRVPAKPALYDAFGIAGGKKKTCKISYGIGIDLTKNHPKLWEDTVTRAYEIEKKRVYYHEPINKKTLAYYTIDPSNSTLDDIEIHTKRTKKTKESTLRKYRQYWQLMQKHPLHPIDFKNPTNEAFFNYMEYIEEHGDLDRWDNLKPTGIHGLINRQKAWDICKRAWDYEHWRKYPVDAPADNSGDKPICTPETVHALLHFDFVSHLPKTKFIIESKRDINRYISYIFFFGFFIGMAFEKEFVLLDLGNVHIDQFGNHYIEITRPKVGSKKRKLNLEKTTAASKVHKSVKNYLDYTRPKFVEKDEKALFVDPRTGKRWTCDRLKNFITKCGQLVYPDFYPYLMRHWCGTARLIEWDKDNNAIGRVQFWLGHKNPKETLIYAQLSYLFNDNNGSWLNRALKRYTDNNPVIGGMHEVTGVAQQTTNKGVVGHLTRRSRSQPPQARILDTY